jgi:hypothetical protein
MSIVLIIDSTAPQLQVQNRQQSIKDFKSD